MLSICCLILVQVEAQHRWSFAAEKVAILFFPPHMGLDCDCVGAGALKNVLQQLLNDVLQFISNTSLTIKQQIKALASTFPHVTSWDKNFVTLRHTHQELIKSKNQLHHFLVVSSSGQTCLIRIVGIQIQGH